MLQLLAAAAPLLRVSDSQPVTYFGKFPGVSFEYLEKAVRPLQVKTNAFLTPVRFRMPRTSVANGGRPQHYDFRFELFISLQNKLT